jgi:DNA-binding LacI/PurR family transcriptional regulator
LTRVSIRDDAKIAGVSIATVSRCVNDPARVLEKTRIKVQGTMHKAGMAIEEGWIVEGGLTIDGAIRATRSLLHHHHRPKRSANGSCTACCARSTKASARASNPRSSRTS